MSRRQEVCRDFQRGTCRFGTRCKFVHQGSQQQQQQQQQQQRNKVFESGGRRQQSQQQVGFGGGGVNPFEVLAGTDNVQRQQQQPAKDHKCIDPRVCRDQIKEDFTNEHPIFWRLTCYAHWKFLPNDVAGDVSPEELRALAYDGAKQGLSLHQLAQNEGMLVAAKNAEFEALLRNPYQPPVAQSSSSLSTMAFPSSPFLSTPEPGTTMIFGQPVAAPNPSQGFGQPASSFGGSPGFPSQQPLGGFENGFNKGPTAPGLSASPFSTNEFAQNGKNAFGVQSPFSQHSFGTAGGGPNTGFSAFGDKGAFGTSQPGSAGFGGASPFSSPTINTTVTPIQSPFGLGFMAPASTTSSLSFQPQVLSGISTSQENGQEIQPSAADDMWLKDKWKLGEIPEEEPPPYLG